MGSIPTGAAVGAELLFALMRKSNNVVANPSLGKNSIHKDLLVHDIKENIQYIKIMRLRVDSS